RLVLHPDDVALVQQHLAHDLEAAGWLICGDETLTRGGCRVDAASGELDATLEARWEQVAATLGQNRTRTG
ncbi:MAG TPA: FliH/SctL family protein, partial [Burkholderiales bacterium]